MEKSYLLGISAGYHDSAAAIVVDGEVKGAVEEERFTGIKHDNSFPINSINWLLNEVGIKPNELSAVCYYEDPRKKLDRIEKSLRRGGIKNIFKRGKILERNRRQYLDFEKDMRNLVGDKIPIIFGDHHYSHAAYAYYTSDFKEASIITVDGVGEWDTLDLFHAEGNKIVKLEGIDFPSSLGMLYSTFTAFLGFKPLEGEYKVMGLAPYGDPSVYEEQFKKLYTLEENNSFSLNMDYFVYDWNEYEMFNRKLSKLFDISPRLPGDEFTQKHKDIAAGLQHTYEFLFFRLLDRLKDLRPTTNLCVSGGCAYNGTANGKILDKTNFKDVWIPPAPSDAGSAIGACLHYYYTTNNSANRKQNKVPYLGPYYTDNDVLKVLKYYSDKVYFEKKLDTSLIEEVAELIRDGNVVGWFEGKLEFGARALGNRSILANPRDPDMKSRLNKVVKKREGFRPFAPIVQKSSMTKYFDYPQDVPYMNQVVKVKKKYHKELPSITHVDGSARIQTLERNQHRRMSMLLKKLNSVNKYPIVLNTSFNLKDQTMVLDPKSAIETYLNCDMDVLVIQHYIIKKK
jgi:carbamoyltransferase